MKKISEKTIQGYSTKYLTSTIQNCQGHEKQGMTKYHRLNGDLDIMMKCKHGLDLGIKRDTNGKTGEIGRKSVVQLIVLYRC